MTRSADIEEESMDITWHWADLVRPLVTVSIEQTVKIVRYQNIRNCFHRGDRDVGHCVGFLH
jgi:hypothetical protein